VSSPKISVDPAVGRIKIEQHVDDRRFPGSVGPEEAQKSPLSRLLNRGRRRRGCHRQTALSVRSSVQRAFSPNLVGERSELRLEKHARVTLGGEKATIHSVRRGTIVLRRLAGRPSPLEFSRSGALRLPLFAVQDPNLVATNRYWNRDRHLVHFDGHAATFFSSGALRAPLLKKRGRKRLKPHFVCGSAKPDPHGQRDLRSRPVRFQKNRSPSGHADASVLRCPRPESGRHEPLPESGPSPRTVRRSPGLCLRRCAGPVPSRL